jgi:hypothetical protein
VIDTEKLAIPGDLPLYRPLVASAFSAKLPSNPRGTLLLSLRVAVLVTARSQFDHETFYDFKNMLRFFFGIFLIEGA